MQKNKKRSASEEKERCGTLKDRKKTLSVDVLRQPSFEYEDDVTLVDHHALESDGKETPSKNGDSFRSSNGNYVDTAASTTSYPHHYVTLTPDIDESPYEESRSTTQRIMKDTLDLVLMKSYQFLRLKEDRGPAERARCVDWDILSEVPFTFESLAGHRFEIFAASLKADPAKAYSLMVLPNSVIYDSVCVLKRIYLTRVILKISCQGGLKSI